MEDLEDFKESPWDEEVQKAYTETLSSVGALNAAIKRADEPELMLCQRLMGFGAMLPPKFLKLVREGRPRTLVIMAALFTLVESMSGIWWVGDAYQAEIVAIRSVVQGHALWEAVLNEVLSIVKRRPMV